MIDRQNVENIMNPRGLEHPVATGAALAVGTLALAGINISTYLHRVNHGGVVFDKRVQTAFEWANHFTTGMTLRDWWVHLTHHEHPDEYNELAHSVWNQSRPDGAPEAPIEAFRDPYSVKLEGFMRVKFLTPVLHGRARRKLVPWVLELAEYDKESGINNRDHWPKYLRNVDIEKAQPDRYTNKRSALGIAALGGAITAIKGPKVGLVWAGVHVGGLLMMGGMINADAHTGQKSGFVNRLKVLLGKEQPVPDEKGEYAANVLHGKEGLLFGEYHHQYHRIL